MFSILKRQAKIPVLCYHSMVADTNNYLGNDHLALQADLDMLGKLGFRLISSSDLVDFIQGKSILPLGVKKLCCITFDDAPAFDYYDFFRPHLGTILSFRSILLESVVFRKSKTPITNFAIASEEVRIELDQTCLEGKGEWSSEWWMEAISSRLFEIANHSYDHMHNTLKKTNHTRGESGNFYAVDNYEDADRQIRKAQDELDKLTGGQSQPFFAYPYGQVNEYLAREYLPNFQNEHRQIAAFSTAGDFAHKNSSRWNIPRFVCGNHWKTPEELQNILTYAN